MLRLSQLIVALTFMMFSVSAALAVNPDEVLDDPVLEQRARALSVDIRCLVCQNQSIDDSDAQLARDLRVLVREQLIEGKSDDEILSFLVARYGEFVLLRPRFGTHTLVLWFLPLLALLLGGAVLWRMFSKRQLAQVTAPPLSADEEKALQKILEDRNR